MLLFLILILVAVFTAVAVVVALAILLHKRAYPEKSFYMASMNVLMEPLRLLGVGPMNPRKRTFEHAFKWILKKAKLSDYGGMQFLDNYKQVMDTPLYKSLRLTNIGAIVQQMELRNNMLRRAKLIDYFKTVPEVSKVAVTKPIFVGGLGRTGTTFVHRLLSLDPKCHSPKLWELLRPVPDLKVRHGVDGAAVTAEVFHSDREIRAKWVRHQVKLRKEMGDEALVRYHELDADLSEECTMALMDELPLAGFMLSTTCCKAEILRDFHGPTVQRAYEYYRKVLQILSYQVGDVDEKSNPHWVLKAPFHTFYFSDIAAVFPDAKFVWAHRHPVPTMTSQCGLVQAMHSMYYKKETFDSKQAAHGVAQWCDLAWHRGHEDIQQQNLNCAHVHYKDLVKDPFATVQAIYKQFGWEFTAEYADILRDFLAEDEAKRSKLKQKVAQEAKRSGKDVSQLQGKLHATKLEDFGLSEAAIMADKSVQDYMKAFNIPLEQ